MEISLKGKTIKGRSNCSQHVTILSGRKNSLSIRLLFSIGGQNLGWHFLYCYAIDFTTQET